MSVMTIGGGADDEYGPIVDAFAATLADDPASGAALAVRSGGREVVSVWAGVADGRTGRPWAADTGTVVFSVTKGLSSIVIGRLVDAGLLDLDTPVAELWPEFAAHGKGALAIGDVLAHRAGVSVPDAPLNLADVTDSRRWAARIARQAPIWTPGTGHAYHALTFGPIAQEIVRRSSGRELADIFREEVADPLAAHLTLHPDTTDAEAAAVLTTSPAWAAMADLPSRDSDLLVGALTLGGLLPATLAGDGTGFNDPVLRRVGFAGGGAIGSAAAIAAVWSSTIVTTDGVRTLHDAALTALCRPRSEGPWALDWPGPLQRWGAGIELSSPAAPMLSPASFGHGGAGGQAGFADPDAGIALGHVRNRLDVADPIPPIVSALQRVLG